MGYQPRHSERSWTDNRGGHFFVQTASFGDPDLPGRLFHDALHHDMSPSHRDRRRHPSLLGSIFSIIDNQLSNSRNRSAIRSSTPRSVQRERSSVRFRDEPVFDQDFAHPTRRSSMQHDRGYRGTDSIFDDAHNTEARSRRERNYRQRSYRDESEYNQPSHRERTSSRQASPDSLESDRDSTEIGRLEHAVRCEEQGLRHCHRTIRSLARGRDGVAYRQIQQLEAKIAEHKATLTRLQNDLLKAKLSRPRRSTNHRQAEAMFPDFDDFSQTSTGNAARRRSVFDDNSAHFFAFTSSFGPGRSAARAMHDPIAAEMLFQDFTRLHRAFSSDLFDDDFPFGAQRARSTRSSHPFSSGSRYEQGPKPRQAQHTSTRPELPPNLLKVEEARSLYAKYDKRWNELSHNDASIPYPGRGLDARSLLARDTIWAADIPTPVVLWSAQDVMNANIQAFYLAVNKLTPTYELAGAKIMMGFDRRQASTEQINALLDMLKKEKMRWHSDRLGRRNNGRDGINEALQSNEQARAVFHAVCELKEYATAA